MDKVLAEIQSSDNIEYIEYLSNQYCDIDGEYDPLSSYKQHDDIHDFSFSDFGPWGNGQNGEQWPSDI